MVYIVNDCRKVIACRSRNNNFSGAGIDVWVGSGEKRVDAVMCTVDCLKRDSEIKILIGCTEEEKLSIYRAHNDTQYMKGIMIRR